MRNYSEEIRPGRWIYVLGAWVLVLSLGIGSSILGGALLGLGLLLRILARNRQPKAETHA